jgi:hypothetical protein
VPCVTSDERRSTSRAAERMRHEHWRQSAPAPPRAPPQSPGRGRSRSVIPDAEYRDMGGHPPLRPHSAVDWADQSSSPFTGAYSRSPSGVNQDSSRHRSTRNNARRVGDVSLCHGRRRDGTRRHELIARGPLSRVAAKGAGGDAVESSPWPRGSRPCSRPPGSTCTQSHGISARSPSPRGSHRVCSREHDSNECHQPVGVGKSGSCLNQRIPSTMPRCSSSCPSSCRPSRAGS